MHTSSMENMQKCHDRYARLNWPVIEQPLNVIDVGGANVNGSYADIFSGKDFFYQAVDIAEGEGVDVIMEDPYKLPFNDSSIDLVISGQALEHVEFFWETFKEMVRVLKEDGLIFIIAPSAGAIHRHPVDCYCFYPDAYQALAKYTNCYLVDCWRDERGLWKDLVGVYSKSEKVRKFSPSLIEGLDYFDLEEPTVFEKSKDEIKERVQGEMHYRLILGKIHQLLNPDFYLEIGVRSGLSLKLAECDSFGIDPAPLPSLNLSDNHKLYKMTSDFFFEWHGDEVEDKNIDLSFIDGMHLVENVLRDFINIEKLSHSKSVIAIDDIFPNHISQANRNRETKTWTGDVWKIAIILKNYRKDLNISYLDTHPTGLMVISNLNPEDTTLFDSYNEIVKMAKRLNLEDYKDQVLHRKNAITPNVRKIKSIISNAFEPNLFHAHKDLGHMEMIDLLENKTNELNSLLSKKSAQFEEKKRNSLECLHWQNH